MTTRARLAVVLVMLALPLLLQGASLPHTHVGGASGLFNQEHDLTLLATIGTVASDVAAAPALLLVLVAAAAACPARHRRPTMRSRAADSRAPPTR